MYYDTLYLYLLHTIKIQIYNHYCEYKVFTIIIVNTIFIVYNIINNKFCIYNYMLYIQIVNNK